MQWPQMSMTLLSIGELAQQTGVNAVTLRYYEKFGLISTQRSEGGHRLYAKDMIARLHFIQNTKSVGFTLEEIQELLHLKENPKQKSHTVRALTLNKLKAIDEKMDALKKIKLTLKALVEQCDGNMPIEKCPILAGLSTPSSKKTSCKMAHKKHSS